MENYSEDRNNVIDWAKKILEEKDQWLILDTETTGLHNAEMVQLGLIDLEGKIVIDTLIKPTISIPPDASAIHGITDETVKNALSFPEIYPLFVEKIKDKKILIYNKAFDTKIISYCCQVNNLPDINLYSKSQCLMLEYAVYYGEWNDYHQNYKWQPLYGGDHSAVGDCKASLKLLNEMANDDDSDF
ncbi:MAG: 3'-5' exonuclease [Xenococcus sp. (in: cyanobacteria)]